MTQLHPNNILGRMNQYGTFIDDEKLLQMNEWVRGLVDEGVTLTTIGIAMGYDPSSANASVKRILELKVHPTEEKYRALAAWMKIRNRTNGKPDTRTQEVETPAPATRAKPTNVFAIMANTSRMLHTQIGHMQLARKSAPLAVAAVLDEYISRMQTLADELGG